MEENTLSVLKIAPGQHPQQVEMLIIFVKDETSCVRERLNENHFYTASHLTPACSPSRSVSSRLLKS